MSSSLNVVGCWSTFQLQNRLVHDVISLVRNGTKERARAYVCTRVFRKEHIAMRNRDTARRIVFVTRLRSLPCTFSGMENGRSLATDKFDRRKALPQRRSTSFFRRNRRCCPRLALSADKVGIREALTSAQTRANDVESEKWERERGKKRGKKYWP